MRRFGSLARLATQASSTASLGLYSRHRSVTPVSADRCCRHAPDTREQPRRLSACRTAAKHHTDKEFILDSGLKKASCDDAAGLAA